LTLYNASAARVADRIKGIWAQRLETRDLDAKTRGGTRDVGSRDVLRALAGKLNER
jgi:hypothetical protein